MAVNNESDEVQAALVEFIRSIVIGVMEGVYLHESDDMQSPEPEETPSITDDDSELPSGDALSLSQSEPAAQTPETAPLILHTVQEIDGLTKSSVREESQSGGDAPSSESGTVDPSPTSEGGPHDDGVMPAAVEDIVMPTAVEDAVMPAAVEDIVMPTAVEDAVMPAAAEDVVMPAAAEDESDELCADSEEPAKEIAVMDSELIGKESPAVEVEKPVSPRRKSTWKSVKRVFRVLFCCGCKTARS
ncbi:unnamed protein product [Macrosiphum euphorbiae]|uniref:Uncharacterized protein n=1 Tax=Macrosiphum euphorbiae TaxID=13131 RepID=A0AAV0W7M8_9HEMI|nr:unnamed protein product [Macrosiphum euphorbiae]